jgi:hypothetical protein
MIYCHRTSSLIHTSKYVFRLDFRLDRILPNVDSPLQYMHPFRTSCPLTGEPTTTGES